MSVRAFFASSRYRAAIERESVVRVAFRGAIRTAQELAVMAKSLERDVQVESLPLGRRRELGIDMETGRSLSRGLANSVSFDRGRDLGMSR